MKLSPRCRELVVLVGRDGHTYESAAREMGLSISTVRVYAARVGKAMDIEPPLHALIHAWYLVVRPVDGKAD